MEKEKDRKKKTPYNPEVTREDISALGKKDLSMDSADDRILKERKEVIDFTGKGLDISGAEPSKKTGGKSLKDEENTLYAQGGERKEHLEEQNDSINTVGTNPNDKS